MGRYDPHTGKAHTMAVRRVPRAATHNGLRSLRGLAPLGLVLLLILAVSSFGPSPTSGAFFSARVASASYSPMPPAGALNDRQDSSATGDGPVTLTGTSLTVAEVLAVARAGRPVSIASPALQQVLDSYHLLLAASDQGIPIYGLNRGVGLNKDRTIFTGPAQDPEARRLSEQWNANNLRTSSGGAGPDAPEDIVRAAMLIRLNTLLLGRAAVQPYVAELYLDFLNDGITPVLPSRGSIGESDMTILAGVGLAMMGEGEVDYQGQRIPAGQALADAGLQPLVPFGKDSLAIISSNAYAAAWAIVALSNAQHLLGLTPTVVALSLEGLNGNIAPFLPAVGALRPFPGIESANAAILGQLDGSYLWQTSDQRVLQDPLSFRTAGYVLSIANESLTTLASQLLLQVNSSDDNPAVVLGLQPPADVLPQEAAYYVTTGPAPGAVLPTTNFESLPWAVSLESLNIALGHLSRASAERMNRLDDPDITHLSRFLAPDGTTLAFSAIQKVYVALDAQDEELTSPMSETALPVAGDIEDVASNAPAVAQRTAELVDNLYYMVGMELMHAAQAIDLRRQQDPTLSMGTGTSAMFAAFRQQVPFLDHDRALTPDISAAHDFLSSFAS